MNRSIKFHWFHYNFAIRVQRNTIKGVESFAVCISWIRDEVI